MVRNSKHPPSPESLPDVDPVAAAVGDFSPEAGLRDLPAPDPAAGRSQERVAWFRELRLAVADVSRSLRRLKAILCDRVRDPADEGAWKFALRHPDWWSSPQVARGMLIWIDEMLGNLSRPRTDPPSHDNLCKWDDRLATEIQAQDEVVIPEGGGGIDEEPN
jgi:hypothetical protein